MCSRLFHNQKCSRISLSLLLHGIKFVPASLLFVGRLIPLPQQIFLLRLLTSHSLYQWPFHHPMNLKAAYPPIQPTSPLRLRVRQDHITECSLFALRQEQHPTHSSLASLGTLASGQAKLDPGQTGPALGWLGALVSVGRVGTTVCTCCP